MHGLMTRLARVLAILGGIVLSGLVLLVCLSILGREVQGLLNGWFGDLAPGLSARLLATGIGPINGDFELVEAAMPFAIFAFLPLCQLSGAHAAVDIFTTRMPGRVTRPLRIVTEILFAAVLVLIAWQLFQGMLSKMRSGQTTFLIQFPIWWAYAASLVGAVGAALVGCYLALARLAEGVTGRTILPPEEGEAP